MEQAANDSGSVDHHGRPKVTRSRGSILGQADPLSSQPSSRIEGRLGLEACRKS